MNKLSATVFVFSTVLSLTLLYSCNNDSSNQVIDGDFDEESEQESEDVVADDHLFKQISVGHWESCGVTRTDGLICWGSCQSPVIGGVTNSQDTFCNMDPFVVPGFERNVSSVKVSGSIAYVIFTNGSLKSLGRYPGVPTDFVEPVTKVATGASHTCVLTLSGSVKCWGSNYHGELGFTTTENCTPSNPDGASWPCSKNAQTVTGLTTGVIDITAGNQYTCAALSNGIAKCWGLNDQYQLGDGTMNNSTTPVSVQGLTEVAAVYSGGTYTCVTTRIGAVKCWGSNGYGQLGDGTTDGRATPVDVVGLSNGVISVAPENYHNCALLATGSVKCWGLYAVLGQVNEHTSETCNTPDSGPQECSKTPLAVFGLDAGVNSIASGTNYTCVVLDNGHAKCWGANGYKQLGDGTTTNRQIPVDVAW